FHCVPLARLDAHFAKRQLLLILREYYMHPNGQIPAYEWNFGDVNPPVHAWGTWKVYEIDKQNTGKGDTDFLEMVFHKLLLNFTWWVNQRDRGGNNIFEGGFLGLDNIGIFDRNATLPHDGFIEQADGTSWMAMYSLNMLRMALELSQEKPYYQEMASKFFNHFLTIAGALANVGDDGVDLWDEEDEFFYDILHISGHPSKLMKVRSMVGLIPLFAVEVLTPELLAKLPDFTRRLEEFLEQRPDLAALISRWTEPGKGETRLLSLLRGHRMKCLIRRMVDSSEFSLRLWHRALSKFHEQNPYILHLEGTEYMVRYTPGESDNGLFGGNSNWRGPIWFPVNYLIVESLLKFHSYYGEDFKMEFPTGSGKELNLREIAIKIEERLIRIFRKDKNGERPCLGNNDLLQHNHYFEDHLLFHEYFHGDTGEGLGASHQTGWTGLVADLIHQVYQREKKKEME
ncbi:MAG: glucosidase, partial [Cytophagales bacterium]|nr:glucosidase [Cytophagales bacterium]